MAGIVKQVPGQTGTISRHASSARLAFPTKPAVTTASAAPPPPRALRAYIGPFALFIVLTALPGLVRSVSPTAPWWLHSPEFWVYPLQTFACAAMLLFYRREYPQIGRAHV